MRTEIRRLGNNERKRLKLGGSLDPLAWNKARRWYLMPGMAPPDIPAEATGDLVPDNLAEAGVYPTAAAGFDRGLVVLAMGQSYCLVPSGAGYRLLVEPLALEAVREQLACYERESVGWPPRPAAEDLPARSIGLFASLVWALVVLAVFCCQDEWPGAAGGRRRPGHPGRFRSRRMVAARHGVVSPRRPGASGLKPLQRHLRLCRRPIHDWPVARVAVARHRRDRGEFRHRGIELSRALPVDRRLDRSLCGPRAADRPRDQRTPADAPLAGPVRGAGGGRDAARALWGRRDAHRCRSPCHWLCGGPCPRFRRSPAAVGLDIMRCCLRPCAEPLRTERWSALPVRQSHGPELVEGPTSRSTQPHDTALAAPVAVLEGSGAAVGSE